MGKTLSLWSKLKIVTGPVFKIQPVECIWTHVKQSTKLANLLMRKRPTKCRRTAVV